MAKVKYVDNKPTLVGDDDDGKLRIFGKTLDEMRSNRRNTGETMPSKFSKKDNTSPTSKDKPNIASRTDFSDEKIAPKFKAPKKMAKEKIETPPGDMGSVDRTADVIGPDMSKVNKDMAKPTRDFTATEMAQNLMSPGYNKMKKGGSVKPKKMSSNGKVKKMSSGGKTSQLAKANGIAVRGKTRGKIC
jgi:hypothetical protein